MFLCLYSLLSLIGERGAWGRRGGMEKRRERKRGKGKTASWFL